MKNLFIFTILLIHLTGCNKEKQIYKKLEGTWTVSEENIYWQNNSSTNINHYHREDFGVLTLDNKGNGQLITNPYTEYWNGEIVYQVPSFTYNIEYREEDSGKMLLTNPETQQSESYNLRWSYDKKTFFLVSTKITYEQETPFFYDHKLTCKKQN